MKTTPPDAMKVIVAGGHSFTDKTNGLQVDRNCILKCRESDRGTECM